MKKWICALVLTAASLAATAQVAPESLASNMKVMSTKLKAIAGQINNPAQNPQSAVLADEFTAAALKSKTFVPDSVAALPASEQAARLATYDQMLDHAGTLGAQLATALRANDNAKATDLLSQLSQAKKDGHAEFKTN